MPHLSLRDARGFLAGLVLLLTACGGSASTTSDSPSPAQTAMAAEDAEPSTLDGVYTEEQAERGLAVYENVCSRCHEAEEWQDDGFKARWDGESVYRFWYYIYERMPNGEPPYSLPREQVSDVVTYILQLNGLPPGDTELGSDDDSIDVHWLRWGSGS